MMNFNVCAPSIAVMALAIFALAPARPATSQDKVYPKQGVQVSGKISKLNPNEVVISVRGKDQTYAMSDVRKVSFDGEPNGLDRAREQVLLNQYSQALEELQKLAAADLKSVPVQQDVEFYRWYSEGKLGLAGSGDKAAAARGLLALATKNRATHHLFALSEMLGELSLSMGQAEKATGYFKMMGNAADTEVKARGVYQMGKVGLALGETAEAKLRFEQLISTPANTPELIRMKTLAEVGLAVCQNIDGNSQAALDSLNVLIQKNDSSDLPLFALINNAAGACYQALEQPKQALIRYLQTDLLFFTAPEAHAEALYHLSQLWSAAGDPARGAEARARLVSRYASSVWANKP